MPPFSNQFSLSLELTRLIPTGLATSNAFMSLARSLRNSGSDVVIEEDLAILFGRCRIFPQMATSFRTLVAREDSSLLNTLLGLTLEGGPGPTVLRGLTQAPYFAVVIQCSFLTSIHEKNSLAAALAQIFEREAEHAERHLKARAAPSYEGIYGVLRACEDQTSSYNWRNLILATAGALDIAEYDAFSAIPSTVLQGAVHMFPLVQSLPDDRIILIDTGMYAGACPLVVWAHQVLGLTVLVKRYGPSSSLIEKQFGIGTNNVVIDLRDKTLLWNGDNSILEIKQPSITLLSVSDNEELITLKSESDEVAVDAIFKRPAGGYGRGALESVCGNEEGREALVHESTLLALAFAAIISKQLFTKPLSALTNGDSLPGGITRDNLKNIPTDSTPQYNTINQDERQMEYMKCMVSEQAIIAAGRFLFQNPGLNMKSIASHVLIFSHQPLNVDMEQPGSITLILDYLKGINKEDLWSKLFETVRYLSIIVLAFAFVRDLQSCTELPLRHNLPLLSQHVLIDRLKHWDGTSRIWIPEDTWFLVLARLLIGGEGALDSRSTCLVSDHGWSIFLSTFGHADPSFTDSGYFVIKKGVPCRNEVRKHSIIDGPIGVWGDEWKIVHAAGTEESLRCANAVRYDRPFCGEQQGSFLVTLRFSTETAPNTETRRIGLKGRVEGNLETRRSGYRELFGALWGVQHTQSCHHNSSAITLPLSCVSVAGFGDLDMSDLKESARIFVCLTAHNSCARWRALLAIHTRASIFPTMKGIDQILLRGEDCCFECAVNQAVVRTGYWFLIL
ncbi:MAG: hypothetical protein Q9187_005019 [Circinaria calcarea]